ncbi:MAG: tRNA lysidine(34) synthetase TilS [Christensenellales bacterium]
MQASYAAVGRPGRVLLALSGGVDSVVLLHALVSLRKLEGFVLSAVHVHHGLRAEADADAEFVQVLCAQLDVKVVVVRVQVGPGNLEAEARDARYRVLHAQAQQEDADVIALAHHADDQVETILMHWMRGAGGQGLAGMRELSGNLWRPLLTLPRAHLERAAEEMALLGVRTPAIRM